MQLGQSLVALVVGEQHLATPDGAVGAVAGPVEGEAEHLLRSVQPVFGHHRRDVRVVVLHRCGPGGPPALRSRPGGGPVQRMRVGDNDFRVRRRSAPRRCRCAASNADSVARSSMSPMCWLSQAYLPSATAMVFFRSPPTASVGGTGTGNATGSGA